jgi:NADH-quinone oxidoreductase subunit J
MSTPIPLAVLCAAALATAVAVILPRRPMHGAIALLAHSLCLAGLYVCLQAELVAMGQVIIYSGAVVVLLLFVVLLLPKGGREGRVGPRRYVSALVAGSTFFSVMMLAVAVTLPDPKPAAAPTAKEFGRSLFGSLLVPFELTAPLLLVAIVGAVALWRRQESAES